MTKFHSFMIFFGSFFIHYSVFEGYTNVFLTEKAFVCLQQIFFYIVQNITIQQNIVTKTMP